MNIYTNANNCSHRVGIARYLCVKGFNSLLNMVFRLVAWGG